MTKITLEYFGMPGQGATVKEAKAAAGAAIERALKGDYAPVFVQWRGTRSILSRDPWGWGYRFIHTDAPVQTVSHCTSGYQDRDECLQAMLNHIADNERVAGDSFPTELFEYLRRPSLIRDAERRWNDRTAWVELSAAEKAQQV